MADDPELTELQQLVADHADVLPNSRLTAHRSSDGYLYISQRRAATVGQTMSRDEFLELVDRHKGGTNEP